MLSGDCSSPFPLSLHSDSLSAQITATKTLIKDFGVFFPLVAVRSLTQTLQ